MLPQKYQVKDVVSKVKKTLSEAFPSNILIEGELRDFKCSSMGHWYFTLSDETSALAACLFKGEAFRNPLIKQFKTGDQVLCLGRIDIYAKSGSIQFIVQRMYPAGKGEKELQLEALKNKLKLEGLFDIDQKKLIPRFPKRIAIITAKGSAACADILNILERRTTSQNILIIPAVMQGEQAASSVCRAFMQLRGHQEKMTPEEKIDVVVIARGGGGQEDLSAFNDESLARMIYACEIPVISAIGHQIDFTIADMVADLRAETPSAAAELLSEGYYSISEKILRLQANLILEMKLIMKDRKERMQRVSQIVNLRNMLRIDEKIFLLDKLGEKLVDRMRQVSLAYTNRMEKVASLLTALDYHQVLKRGYAIVKKKSDDQVISNYEVFARCPKSEQIKICFHDGEAIVGKDEHPM